MTPIQRVKNVMGSKVPTVGAAITIPATAIIAAAVAFSNVRADVQSNCDKATANSKSLDVIRPKVIELQVSQAKVGAQLEAAREQLTSIESTLVRIEERLDK